MRKTVAPPRYTHNLVALRIYRIPYHRTTFCLEKGSAVISKRRGYKSIETVSLPFRVFWAGTILDTPGEQPGSIAGVERMQRQAQTVNDSTIQTGGKIMNRKLFRLITLVVTVLMALAITAPALADPPGVKVFIWEEDFPAENPCEEIEDEIWITIHYNWQVRYEYDNNGELVEIIYHSIDRWHVYNHNHPELFINGMLEGTGHFNEKQGEWGTGVNVNFHAPGYPQIAHISGNWTADEDGNLIFKHGRLVVVNTPVFCELLTPP